MYIPFSDWFGTKRTVSVCFQINHKMVNTIWFWLDLIRFRKDLSAYGWRIEDDSPVLNRATFKLERIYDRTNSCRFHCETNWVPIGFVIKRETVSTIVFQFSFLSKGIENIFLGIYGATNCTPKIDFNFLSNWMEYDRGDSFPLDSEPNVILMNQRNKVCSSKIIN